MPAGPAVQFLHTSRTRPSHVPQAAVPAHLREAYKEKTNDLTPDILKTSIT